MDERHFLCRFHTDHALPQAEEVLSAFAVVAYKRDCRKVRDAWTRFDFREAWVWLDALLSANSRAAGNILAQTFADLAGSGPKVLFFEFMGREGNKPAEVPLVS